MERLATSAGGNAPTPRPPAGERQPREPDKTPKGWTIPVILGESFADPVGVLSAGGWEPVKVETPERFTVLSALCSHHRTADRGISKAVLERVCRELDKSFGNPRAVYYGMRSVPALCDVLLPKGKQGKGSGETYGLQCVAPV